MMWIYAHKEDNVTLRVDAMYLGERGVGEDEASYIYQPPVISQETYYEIVSAICDKKRKSQQVHDSNFEYLRFSKLNGEIIRSQRVLLAACGSTVCPECHFGNCIGVICGGRMKLSALTNLVLPSIWTCGRCQTSFLTTSKKFYPCNTWECKQCERRFAGPYGEFVAHRSSSTTTAAGTPPPSLPPPPPHLSPKAWLLYHRLSSKTQADLNNDPSLLSYSLMVEKKKLVPPFTLLMDEQKTVQFYHRLLLDASDPATVKTNFGSVLDRMEKGKLSAIRQYSHNTRYAKSGRGVIVPHVALEPDECVLPKTMWRNLECPRTVLLHRYPTLNQRNFSVHRVVGTWTYPTVGIPTSIVRGNNADFDGDAMQVIPMLDLPSEAEALTLFHPSKNMIVPGGELRVFFDHDEILALYHLYKINGEELHRILRDLVRSSSSSYVAYNVFCLLRRICARRAVVFPITYTHLLDFVPPSPSFTRFVRETYRKTSGRDNVLKLIILARSSRFRIEHLWQMIGIINSRFAPSSNFLGGMKREEFVNMAKMSRVALIKDVAYAGYGYIKLLYCTQTFVLGYDGRVYNNSTGQLVATRIEDLLPTKK